MAWNRGARLAAVAVVLLRAGLSLDFHTLRRHGSSLASLAVLPSVCEALLASAIASFLFTDMPFPLALTCGFLTSPVGSAVISSGGAVVKSRGYAPAAPNLAMAACSFDNATCLLAFNLLLPGFLVTIGATATVKSFLTPPLVTVLAVAASLVAAAVLAATSMWTSRGVRTAGVISAVSALMYTATFYSENGAGSVASLSLGMALRHAWLRGTPRCLVSAEHGSDPSGVGSAYLRAVQSHLSILWDALLAPLMFTLLGANFNLTDTAAGQHRRGESPDAPAPGLVARCFAYAAALVAIKFLLAGAVSSRITRLTPRERLYVAMCWTSKANMQAAFATFPRVALEHYITTQPTGSVSAARALSLRTWGDYITWACLASVAIALPLSVVLIESAPYYLLGNANHSADESAARRGGAAGGAAPSKAAAPDAEAAGAGGDAGGTVMLRRRATSAFGDGGGGGVWDDGDGGGGGGGGEGGSGGGEAVPFPPQPPSPLTPSRGAAVAAAAGVFPPPPLPPPQPPPPAHPPQPHLSLRPPLFPHGASLPPPLSGAPFSFSPPVFPFGAFSALPPPLGSQYAPARRAFGGGPIFVPPPSLPLPRVVSTTDRVVFVNAAVVQPTPTPQAHAHAPCDPQQHEASGGGGDAPAQPPVEARDAAAAAAADVPSQPPPQPPPHAHSPRPPRPPSPPPSSSASSSSLFIPPHAATLMLTYGGCGGGDEEAAVRAALLAGAAAAADAMRSCPLVRCEVRRSPGPQLLGGGSGGSGGGGDAAAVGPSWEDPNDDGERGAHATVPPSTRAMQAARYARAKARAGGVGAAAAA